MFLIFNTIILIYPRVRIWHIANTKNVFINLIGTVGEGERVDDLLLFSPKILRGFTIHY